MRQRWSNEFKAQVVTEALEPGASVSAIAHRIGIHPSQLRTLPHPRPHGARLKHCRTGHQATTITGKNSLFAGGDGADEPGRPFRHGCRRRR
ncbi:hypothetical protein CVM73_35505 [Bradyrhizobium forestalis]|uniref:Transposase n=1 Tax=Bradyrhizobium forestalis TaxID=1419263 RepID=A0A2M8QYH8_9BRAD|nr:hypothetical protein CVM73_35505 [Bradyrhizobium forestalis]